MEYNRTRRYAQAVQLRCVLILGAAAMQLWAADPRIGTWKLVSAQAVLDPPRKLVVTREGRGVHAVVSGDIRMEFSATLDGHDNPVRNFPAFNLIAIRRIDKNQSELIEKKDGATVALVQEKISQAGKELTMVTHQAGHADEINVLRRSGGAKDAGNPFVGEWTQDLSETRLRQGLILRIEPVGKDEVHFAGDFSYTAKLDGKDYPLKGSPNDSVAISLVDPRTVESIYKRGDQVVERDRWMVSADGSRLTVTTTGMPVDGETLKEELTFSKQ
jgi:hypothetical protein